MEGGIKTREEERKGLLFSPCSPAPPAAPPAAPSPLLLSVF